MKALDNSFSVSVFSYLAFIQSCRYLTCAKMSTKVTSKLVRLPSLNLRHPILLLLLLLNLNLRLRLQVYLIQSER
jgi:hypothetical protein